MIHRYLAVALLLAFCLTTGCMKRGGAPAGAGGAMGAAGGPPPVAVIVAPAEMRNYAPAIELNGEIRASQQVTLAAEVSGKVLSIAHRVGEKHGKGAGAIIVIDPASYQASVAMAKADLAAAEENLLRLLNGPRPQEIDAQEAAVAAAQAHYDQAQDNLRRQQELYRQGVIPESAIVAAQATADAAQAGLDAALQVLDNLRQGSRKEDINAAQARADMARSGLHSAELILSRTAVVPPFDCVVTKLLVEVGQYVGPGAPLCEVVADAPAEAWFNLPQDQAGSVQAGAVVELRLDALPDEVLTGSVISVSPAADETTRQFPVRVACDDLRLKPGMAARARILTAAPKPTLVISDNASVETKLGLAVFRMVPAGPDDKPFMEGMPPLPSVEQVLVETGDHFDGMVVVLKGDLKPGDMLVTRGKEQLYSSAKIIPTNLIQQGGAGAPGGPPPGAGGAAAERDEAAAPGASAGEGQDGQPPVEGTAPGEAGEKEQSQAGGAQ